MHAAWSDAGQNNGNISGWRRGFLRHAGIASALLLSGCAALGLSGSRSPDTMPKSAATPPGMTLPKVVSVSPPSPEMASVQPPASLTLPPTPRPRPNRPPVPKQPEETPVPAPSPPRVVIADLVGSDFTAIRHVFRSPDSINNDNLSVVWTYAPPGCTLRLFFYPDIKTTVFHLLKYDFRNSSGEMLMPGDACIDSMLADSFRGAASQ